MSTGIDSVTISVPGEEPLTITKDDAAFKMIVPEQLSFDVGGEIRKPAGATLNITGKGELRSQLFMDDDVTIQVIDARGEVVATFDGSVVNVAFVKHQQTETDPEWVERVHKIKLGDAA